MTRTQLIFQRVFFFLPFSWKVIFSTFFCFACTQYYYSTLTRTTTTDLSTFWSRFCVHVSRCRWCNGDVSWLLLYHDSDSALQFDDDQVHLNCVAIVVGSNIGQFGFPAVPRRRLQARRSRPILPMRSPQSGRIHRLPRHPRPSR